MKGTTMLTKIKSLNIIQKIFAVFGIFVILMFSPIVSFIFNFGSAVGMGIGIAVILITVFFDKVKAFFKSVWAKKIGKAIICLVCVVALVAVCYCSVVSIKVLSAAKTDSDIPLNTPAVLLGCRVEGEKPGRMLQRRINAAYDYLTENSEAVCVLSGGQGWDEKMTEAQAMFNSLTEKGISPNRLILEDKSENTKQNIANSKELLGKVDEVVIITTDFHQYRAEIIAERNGLKAYSYSSSSGIFSLPTNIVREWFTVLNLLLRG